MDEINYGGGEMAYPGQVRRLPVGALVNAKEKEGEITEELALFEKNLSRLEATVENLQIKTVRICRPEQENGGEGKTVSCRSSDIGSILQSKNANLCHLINRIESVIERIEI